MTFEVILNYLS